MPVLITIRACARGACDVCRQYVLIKEDEKTSHQCSSQELERIDLKRKLFQPKLSNLDFSIELILNNGVGWFASEIFIGGIAKRDRAARQDVLHSRIETGMLRFGDL